MLSKNLLHDRDTLIHKQECSQPVRATAQAALLALCKAIECVQPLCRTFCKCSSQSVSLTRFHLPRDLPNQGRPCTSIWTHQWHGSGCVEFGLPGILVAHTKGVLHYNRGHLGGCLPEAGHLGKYGKAVEDPGCSKDRIGACMSATVTCIHAAVAITIHIR